VTEIQHKRAHRVAHLIQAALARLLVEGLKDPRVGFVTVTEVRLTDDLRWAQVFVSIFGEAAQRQQTLQGLRAASGYLRREVGHTLQLRTVPELTFVHDDSLDRAQRVQQVLTAAARGAHELPDADALERLPEAHTARSGLPPPLPPVAPAPRGGRGRRGAGSKSGRRSGRAGGSGPRRRRGNAPSVLF
jgi:ribosome-binding factor A